MLAAFCRVTRRPEENDEVRHREYRWIIPPQSLLQIGQMLTIGFWCLWTNWIITAISDFVIMYTTELWAFTGYHFGTMVVGGLVVGAAQPFRLFFAVLSTLIKFDRRAVGIISLFCDCVVQVYMDYLEPWCRNAYMDVALNSYSFVQSALHVSWVNNGDFVDTVHVLNGATWLFQLAGLGAITSLGHLQVCVILKYYPGFEDPYSPAYESSDTEGSSDRNEPDPKPVQRSAPKRNLKDPLDLGEIPSTVPRHCTDLTWLLMYLIFSTVASFQYPYYRPSSNYAPVIYPRAHASGPPEDWGSPEMNYALPPAAKSEYPWLPRKADDSKAARAPHTPHADATADADAKRSLPPGAMTTDPWSMSPRRLGQSVNNDVVHSDWRGNFTLHILSSYPSAPFVDMVCKPWVTELEEQVRDWIDETPLVNTWATLINSYWPLLVAAGTGVVMSYVYITLLRFRAAMLVQLGMVMLFLGPLTTGDDQSRIVRIVTAFGLDQI
eukprot:g19131.t1